ncbi:putative sigma intracellular receptor 2, EXPERA domain-containing protein [Helianthus debilis subsp. tardiflorus]
MPKEATMGALMKLIDTILIIFFLIIAIAAPLLDAQTCLPSNIFPDILVHLKTWYTHEYGDYLVSEKPHFFVGLIWVELLFAWPLSIASIYGIAAGKSWVHTTCLMYGVSTLTAMVAILSEMVGSGKASEKLLNMYYPFLGFAVLAILRGLLPHSSKSNASVTRPVVARKKRA